MALVPGPVRHRVWAPKIAAAPSESCERTQGEAIMSFDIRVAAAIASATVLISGEIALGAEPLCDKADIRLVNSMREIAQPYHGLVNAGGEALAKWAGI